MMNTRDSSDSEDSIPLGSIKSLNSSSNTGLYKPVREQCDFCDQIFNTRIAHMKHSATHIIIPLIKLSLHQCDECLFHFCSLEDLHVHTTSKNHKTSQFPEISEEINTIKYKDILKNIIEKQVVVTCNDTLSNILPKVNGSTNIKTPSLAISPKESDSIPEVGKTSPEIDVIFEISSDSDRESPDREYKNLGRKRCIPVREQSKPLWELSIPERESSEDKDRSSPFSYNSKELSSPSQRRDSSSPIEPIQSRITFEDDIDEDDLIETEELTEPYQATKNSYIFGNCNNNDRRVNSIIIGSQKCNGSLLVPLNVTHSSDDEAKSFAESVHYEELIEPEICDCRYCGRCFCNRLELIKHESSHMRARPPRPMLCYECERYIAGNYRSLRKHIAEQHPTPHHNKLQLHRCHICHLNYYNYTRHVQYYHDSKCKLCKRSFDYQSFDSHNCNQFYNKCNTCYKIYDQFKTHVCEPELISDTYKVIKMCQVCLAFVKNKQNIHYEVIKEYSELGARQQCDQCNKKYFGVFLVNRKVKVREGVEWKKRKPMSNQERLKRMQNRLKMVNKLNKCYLFFYFVS